MPWQTFNRARYRASIVVAYIIMAASVVVSAQPVDSGAASSWFSIGTVIAGGLVSAGIMFGLLQGRLALFEYRLDKNEERVSDLETKILDAIEELRNERR